MNGHNLKPGGFAAALAVLIAVVLASCSPKGAAGGDAACGLSDADFRTEGILEAIPVRATFLDEVSWDIPHQNWGVSMAISRLSLGRMKGSAAFAASS